MLIIGEKINGTRKRVGRAVLERDGDFIRRLARSQAEAGADLLDVNAGTSPDREPDDLCWLVDTVQAVTDKRLCLDSANSEALRAALKQVKLEPMVNSISGETSRLESVLPVVAETGCDVIALALDSGGIPKGLEGRMAIVRALISRTRAAGIDDGRVYFDPLIMTVATDNQSALVALETMRSIRRELPECHLTAGLSNVSFGLPNRTLINQAFLCLALDAGLDSAILDPSDRGLRSALLSAEVVLGRDRFCMSYNKAARAGLLTAP